MEAAAELKGIRYPLESIISILQDNWSEQTDQFDWKITALT